MQKLLVLIPLPLFVNIIYWKIERDYYLLVLTGTVLLSAWFIPTIYQLVAKSSALFTQMVKSVIFYGFLALLYFLVITPIGWIRFGKWQQGKSQSNWQIAEYKNFNWEHPF